MAVEIFLHALSLCSLAHLHSLYLYNLCVKMLRVHIYKIHALMYRRNRFWPDIRMLINMASACICCLLIKLKKPKKKKTQISELKSIKIEYYLLVLTVHRVSAMNYCCSAAWAAATSCHVNQWSAWPALLLPHVVHRNSNPICCPIIWPRVPDDISHCQCVPA